MLKLTKIMTNLSKSFSKKLIFSILVLTVGFFNSCDKEQKLPVEDQGIYVPIEERGQTDLEDLKDVEQKVKEVVGCGGGGISGGISDGTLTVFEETFGLRNEVKIIYYSNEGTRTFAFPLLKDGKIVNLLLVAEDEDDNYYILEKTDRLAYEDVIDTKVSPYIARIFDADSYLSTDIQLSNVRSSLGADYETSKEGDILILKEKTANSGRLSRTSTGNLYSFCPASMISQMVPQYISLLGFDAIYSDDIYDALVAIWADGCFCPSPALVLEYMGLAGQDWFYDDAYWATNPTFPTQVLPSYTDFYTHFPKDADGNWLYGPDPIYTLAGGDVLQVRLDYPGEPTNNVCALKVSIALNGAGINIPNISNAPGLPGTVLGANGKYHFLNAKALSEWMKRTFTTYDEYTPAQYTNTNGVHTLISGKKGIIISIYDGGNASGHADIYTGTTCSNSPNNPSAACGIGGTVHFWELN